VQIGGPDGLLFSVEAGDVLLIPAGVSHKNIRSSQNFVTAGAYPEDISYDMHTGKEEELESVQKRIKEVPMPSQDPVFGSKGPMFTEWRYYG
jgi:uncharacterized protein YjlB